MKGRNLIKVICYINILYQLDKKRWQFNTMDYKANKKEKRLDGIFTGDNDTEPNNEVFQCQYGANTNQLKKDFKSLEENEKCHIDQDEYYKNGNDKIKQENEEHESIRRTGIVMARHNDYNGEDKMGLNRDKFQFEGDIVSETNNLLYERKFQDDDIISESSNAIHSKREFTNEDIVYGRLLEDKNGLISGTINIIYENPTDADISEQNEFKLRDNGPNQNVYYEQSEMKANNLFFNPNIHNQRKELDNRGLEDKGVRVCYLNKNGSKFEERRKFNNRNKSPIEDRIQFDKTSRICVAKRPLLIANAERESLNDSLNYSYPINNNEFSQSSNIEYSYNSFARKYSIANYKEVEEDFSSKHNFFEQNKTKFISENDFENIEAFRFLDASLGLLKMKRIFKDKTYREQGYKYKSDLQLKVLNAVLRLTPYPGSQTRDSLAILLNLNPRSIQIWFQNARQGSEKQISREELKTHRVKSYIDILTIIKIYYKYLYE